MVGSTTDIKPMQDYKHIARHRARHLPVTTDVIRYLLWWNNSNPSTTTIVVRCYEHAALECFRDVRRNVIGKEM